MLGGFDWERLRVLLESVRAGAPLHYSVSDFDGVTRSVVDDELPQVVIVEGVRLLGRELDRYFDLRVWIDCSLEIAAARGMRRDREDGCDAAHLAIWAREWVPKDRRYFDAHRPDLAAEVTYPA